MSAGSFHQPDFLLAGELHSAEIRLFLGGRVLSENADTFTAFQRPPPGQRRGWQREA